MDKVLRRAIVLAAGQGKRMKSAMPKPLHEVCGRSLLWYTVTELRRADVEEITLVASAELEAALGPSHDLGDLRIVIQEEALGTGDAVRLALAALPEAEAGRILIVGADMPLLHADIFHRVFAELDGARAMSLATVKHEVSSNFGRILRLPDGSIERIVEVRDATAEETSVGEMNAGCYAFAEASLRAVVPLLTNANAQREYYLTDTLALVRARRENVAAVPIEEREHALGVNDRSELAVARRALNERLCRQHMSAGVTIIDPATTYLEPELEIGRDTVIYPNTTISRLSRISVACVIGPNTRLSEASIGARSVVRESVVIESSIGADSEVGPFAHLRQGSIVADNVRVGNFVEVKQSRLAAGVRVGHLSYLGDAEVGESANIGAGTITCNYDGVRKHRTVIGKRAFIGSNTSLIAPVEVEDDALTGAGSVVTRRVGRGERVAGNPARPLPTRVES
jgi:bifunctional UDP-N-acetylglucosamine pyrophosphorylase/glucosamine-1-phosphate N-acetyltransferase